MLLSNLHYLSVFWEERIGENLLRGGEGFGLQRFGAVDESKAFDACPLRDFGGVECAGMKRSIFFG